MGVIHLHTGMIDVTRYEIFTLSDSLEQERSANTFQSIILDPQILTHNVQ